MSTMPIIKRPISLSVQVYDFIAKEIRERRIEPGGLLPTEAELSVRLEVSRTVVREAIARLRHEGLVETKKGGRSKVTPDTSDLVFKLNFQEQNLEKLYELRAIIEPEAAAIAAVKATPKQIQALKRLQHKIGAAISEGRWGNDESVNFHKAIIELSGNPYLAQLVVWVDNKVWAFTKKIIVYNNSKMLIDVNNEHAEIVEAIAEHNPERARKIARMHVIKAAIRHDLKIDIPSN